jgi:hypothetical protein
MARWTMIRVAAVHDWPPYRNAPQARASSALSRSQSSNTRHAALPPHSSEIRFSVGAAAAMILRPVSVEPVNETLSTSGARRAPGRWVAGPVDHVDHAGRQAGEVVEEVHQRLGRGGRLLGRLDDGRAAGGERRAELAHGQVDGSFQGITSAQTPTGYGAVMSRMWAARHP